jgi:hypothetical protein
MHGGATPNAKRAAKERLMKLLPLAERRLEELAAQGDHLPTSMMAVKEILARTIGPVQTNAQIGPSGPVINIGFLSPNVQVEVVEPPEQDALPEGEDDTEALDGQVE